MAGKSASDFDVRLGARLKEARVASGLSQNEVGRLIGVSFQQVQRYERGVNRLPGSAFAILHARIGLQMEDVVEGDAGVATASPRVLARTPGADELASLYDGLDVGARRALIELARELLERSKGDHPTKVSR